MTAAWYLNRSLWFRVFRILLVAATFWFIWHEVFVHRPYELIGRDIQAYLTVTYLPAYFLLLGMMIVNWGLEAYKWKQLVSPLESIGFGRAFMATLAGISPGLFTPNRIGEFGGRVLFLKNADPAQAIAATIVGSFSQQVACIALGCLGLNYYVWDKLEPGNWLATGLAFVSLIAVAGVFILYFNVGLIANLKPKNKWLKIIVKKAGVLGKYESEFLSKILLLSFLRYAVFAGQYMLLLWLFDCSISPVAMFCSISVIFLLQAAVPTFALLELGFRGASAIGILGYYSQNNIGILLSSFVLWFVNLVLPALIGLMFYWQIKEQ